jgi:hypothetical protein
MKERIEARFVQLVGMTGTASEGHGGALFVEVERKDAGPGATYHKTYEVTLLAGDDFSFTEI